jgi:hypothetical protein
VAEAGAGSGGGVIAKTLISIAIILVILLHAAPLLYRAERKTMWPFLDWAMYKDSRPAGPIRAYKKRIMGITARGQRESVTTDLTGVSITSFNMLYLQPMWTRDSSAARQLLRRLNRERQDSFVELRLESETYTVTDSGVVKEENPVITYRADASVTE